MVTKNKTASKGTAKAAAAPKITATVSKVTWTKDDGAKLRQRRLALGLSQADVAVGVGRTSSRVAEIENAEVHGRATGPGPEMGPALARYFAKGGQAEKDAAAKKARLAKEVAA